MNKFVLRWLITGIALYAAVQLVPGITYEGGWTTLAGMALIVGLLNAFVRPLLALMSCPLIIVTMGLFILVLNAAVFLLAARLASVFGVSFFVSGFSSAFWGALVVGIVSFFMNLWVREEEEEED
ncbi:MAG: phage holin family protein [Anaerolineales bacterium]|nr:MAG: phage holin family protein [Anaerolineales bacterium]